MDSIRDIRNKARGDLHQRMRIPAFYIYPADAEPELIHVRVHTKFDPMEAFAGGPSGLATMQDMQPKIIFERAELALTGLELKRTGYITIEAGEGYSLDNAMPPDGITVAWNASRLSASELVGLPIPGPNDV